MRLRPGHQQPAFTTVAGFFTYAVIDGHLDAGQPPCAAHDERPPVCRAYPSP